jgi:pimeloyl-ACP methyl ester carboxylesterase
MTATAQTHARCVTANGRRIHLREAGEGPLVLMCHGFPETSWSWRKQLGPLAAAGYHGVAIDLPGYGRSWKPSAAEDTSIIELVGIAAGVVEAVGAEQAVIIGHDWGAPVAWTSAWIRPDVFRGVIGVSVGFGGRGQMALPGNAFGERRPSEAEAEIAGPGKAFYSDYFAAPGALAAEAEVDVRQWLNAIYFSLSGASPLPTFDSFENNEQVVAMLRETAICLTPGEPFSGSFLNPEQQPSWLPEADLDVYVEEFERSGFESALNSYRTSDLDWELLAEYEGRPVEVPALYIGGDRDMPTLWGRDAILRMREQVPNLHDTVIVPECGHWVQQERPEAFNDAMLDFLEHIDRRNL